MTVLSKIAVDPLTVTCRDFHHPWTELCMNASAGLLVSATPYCLRVYTLVYVFSLLMRRRIPTLKDLKRTICDIFQSTAFLVTNAFTFGLFNCLLRNLFGGYYLLTVAFAPTLLGSLTAISVERPARRPALMLYVANVATETLWNMAKARGWVQPLPQGRTLIFGLGMTALLYLYRLGALRQQMKDPFFAGMQFILGAHEAGPVECGEPPEPELQSDDEPSTSSTPNKRAPISITRIADLVRIYNSLLKAKHRTCTHNSGCFRYAVWGGARPLLGGIALQLALKLVMNARRIFQARMDWRQQIFNRSTLKAGLFLGSFSFMYKAISCLLRHSTDRDHALYAVPASIVSATTFNFYPDTTVALYVMWKALHTTYCFGIQHGALPHIPHTTMYLYAIFTSVLFHAGVLEPKALRPSYFKFLQAISGDRLSRFNTTPFDIYGYETSKQATETIKMLKIVEKSSLPAYPFVS